MASAPEASSSLRWESLGIQPHYAICQPRAMPAARIQPSREIRAACVCGWVHSSSASTPSLTNLTRIVSRSRNLPPSYLVSRRIASTNQPTNQPTNQHLVSQQPTNYTNISYRIVSTNQPTNQLQQYLASYRVVS